MSEKEVRFRKLVDKSGRPEIVSLWTDPKRDRNFMKAIKEHRVLTVIQEPRAHRKQFGRPGFHQGSHASYLVFPKPLSVDPQSRVIGISSELTLEPRITDQIPKSASRPKSVRKKPVPFSKTFTIIVRRTGVIETSIDVQASNHVEAKQMALKQIRMQPFDGSKAIIKNKVRARHQ